MYDVIAIPLGVVYAAVVFFCAMRGAEHWLSPSSARLATYAIWLGGPGLLVQHKIEDAWLGWVVLTVIAAGAGTLYAALRSQPQ